MAVWDAESGTFRRPPSWVLTGQLLLWNDGSPAHVQQGPFERSKKAWVSEVQISRSTRDGSRWLRLVIQLDDEVSDRWKAERVDARDRAVQALTAYLHLREWHGDDLGVLYLK